MDGPWRRGNDFERHDGALSMGFSAVTTIVTPAANYDLTDLASAKVELSITTTTDDAWLAKAVSQVSRAISSETQRVLVPEVVQDLFELDRQLAHRGSSRLALKVQLSRWPVIDIVSVVKTLSTGLTQTLVEGTDFRVNLSDGTLTRLDPVSGAVLSWEADPLTVIYMAGYGSLATETHSVPVSPYQVTVSQSAAFSCDQSVKYASGTALTRVSGNPAAGQYSVAAGVYTFAAADSGQSLTFAYGVKSIPDDLAEICLRLITARYRGKDRDPSLVQQETPGVGMRRWWFGGAPGQTGPFAPDIAAALEPYCMPVVA